MNEDSGYIGAEEYRNANNELKSFESIILNHIDRITSISSKEFSKARSEKKTKIIKGMAFTEDNYIPDVAEDYFSAVQQLYDLISAQLEEPFIQQFKDLQKELQKHHDICIKDVINGKDDYRHQKIENYRERFRLLNKFLYGIGYFKRGQIGEVI